MCHFAKLKPSKPVMKRGKLGRLLFLGLPMTQAIVTSLSQGHAPTIALFISERNELYIEKRLHQGMFYLGKTIDSPSSLEELYAIEQHLQSLLHRVLDKEHVNREALVLFALQ